jgi:aryl-alcohol dehydrogenase-like predicted oxidoreductase
MATLDCYRLLGQSGLRVSPLSLGTMTFGAGGAWGTDDAEVAAMIDLYLDRGGNFIDTANYYGNLGGSERLLGELLGDRRERTVLATKYSLSMRPGDPNASGNHRKSMVRSVEDSLMRLRTDYVDLLYLHMWDDHTPADEILRAFDDLVRAGKVLYIGLSDTPAWQAAKMQAIAELRGWSQFCALQISYSLTVRDAERDLMPMAVDAGMGVLPWSPLAGGVLAGKYSERDVTPDVAPAKNEPMSRRTINQMTGRLSPRNLEIAAVAGDVAHEIGVSAAQVALAWTLINPAVVSPIIGARTLTQLEGNLGALEVTLSAEQLARLDEASSIDLGFPHTMLSSLNTSMGFGNVKVEPRR